MPDLPEVEYDTEKWALELLDAAEAENEELRSRLDELEAADARRQKLVDDAIAENVRCHERITALQNKIRVLEQERANSNVASYGNILKDVWVGNEVRLSNDGFREALDRHSHNGGGKKAVPPNQYFPNGGKHKKNKGGWAG